MYCDTCGESLPPFLGGQTPCGPMGPVRTCKVTNAALFLTKETSTHENLLGKLVLLNSHVRRCRGA